MSHHDVEITMLVDRRFELFDVAITGHVELTSYGADVSEMDASVDGVSVELTKAEAKQAEQRLAEAAEELWTDRHDA